MLSTYTGGTDPWTNYSIKHSDTYVSSATNGGFGSNTAHYIVRVVRRELPEFYWWDLTGVHSNARSRQRRARWCANKFGVPHYRWLELAVDEQAQIAAAPFSVVRLQRGADRKRHHSPIWN